MNRELGRSARVSGIEWAIIIFSLVMIAGLFGLALTSLPGVTSFRWAPVALIPAAGITSVLVLLAMVYRQRARINNALWFVLFLGAILYWGVSELMLHLSATNEGAVFWRAMTAIASAFILPTLLAFVAGLTRPKLLERRPLPWLFLFGAAVSLIYIMLSTDLISNHEADQVLTLPYGSHDLPLSPTGGLLYILWIVGVTTMIIVLLAKYRRHQISPMGRAQAKVLLTGTIIFIAGSLLLDVILPTAGVVSIPPMGMIMATIMAALYAYGMRRYNLFVINPATVAPNILQTMAEAVIVTDTKYQILSANMRSEQLLGGATRTMPGAQLAEVFEAKNWKKLRERLETGIPQKGAVNLDDIKVVDGRRTLASVDVSVSQIHDDEGNLAGMVWVFNDISPLKAANAQLANEKASVERKVVERTRELTEAQARLLASVQSLPFGFALIDQDRQVALSNGNLALLLDHAIPNGPKESAAALKEVAERFKPAIDLFACIDEAQARRQPLERNVEIGPRFYRFFLVPIMVGKAPHDEIIGTALLVEDISEAKAAERSREEFFSIASHELRTPLTAIRGNAGMIMDYYRDQLKDPALKDMVADIHSSSLRLITIVNDFLDASRLEQGRIAFKNQGFNIIEVAQKVVDDLNVSHKNPAVIIKLEKPRAALPAVMADSDRVQQILFNVVGNAFKYTVTGSITITFSVIDKNKGIKVSIMDTGSGIPVESQHLLFHKFQQASNNILTRDNTQSTGLGLYISRLLAEGMQGKLYLERSEVNKGSVFALELPAAKDAK